MLFPKLELVDDIAVVPLVLDFKTIAPQSGTGQIRLAVSALAIPFQECGFSVQHTGTAVIEALGITTT